MKRYSMVVLAAALLSIASIAIAGSMTWSKPLVTAADGTLGVNQRIEKQKAVDEELRARVAAMGVFAGYTTQGN